MARESVVSREFTGTKVTVLGLNIETDLPEKVEYTFPVKMDNDNEILKQLTKDFKETNIVPAKVLNKVHFKKLLAMKTEDFIKHAFELDIETRKRLDVQENNEE